MRKLVTIRTISEIRPIDGADAIEIAVVDGWTVVVRKGDFKAGDQVFYFEIDSVLPASFPIFESYNARSSKDYVREDGTVVRGHRLRTIKLRGQVSQGIVTKISDDWDIGVRGKMVSTPTNTVEPIDADFSDFFGVFKYEEAVSANLAGNARGNYPTWLPKTDQERVQNCWGHIQRYESDKDWLIEEKMEGSSMTVYSDGEVVGVTSRNIDLKLDQEGNTFVDVARTSGLIDVLETLKSQVTDKIAIRGELVGPGIQGNIYGLTKPRFYVFDVWVNGRELTIDERELFMAPIYAQVDGDVVKPVPCVGYMASTNKMPIEDLLMTADGKSKVADTLREGLVFKATTVSKNGQVFSFKAISNKYLLKQKD